MSAGGKHTVYPVAPWSQTERLRTFQFPTKNGSLQKSTINLGASNILYKLSPVTIGKPWEWLSENIIEKIISSGRELSERIYHLLLQDNISDFGL